MCMRAYVRAFALVCERVCACAYVGMSFCVCVDVCVQTCVRVYNLL